MISFKFVAMSNQIKAFKFELSPFRIGKERNFFQPIRNGKLPPDILGETMSTLLQAIDDCATIDNIYKCLEELDKGEDLDC